MDAPGTARRWPVTAWRARGRVVVVAAVTALVTVAVVVAVTTPREEVVRVWVQPATVTYDDGSTHRLAVLDRGRDWSTVGGGRRYALYTGRDPSLGYGHWLDVDLPGGAQALGAADVRWTAEGVRLRLPSGHETFVPAASFTGGR